MSSLFLLPRNRDRIFRAIVNTEPANLIGYWPLDETSGTVARDYSGRGNNGAHVGVTLGYPGPGDGRTSTFYDGALDYTNVYSAALAAAFNGAEGTLLIWAQVANAGVWTDGVSGVLAQLRADSNNRILIYEAGANNTLVWNYIAGGVTKAVTVAGHASTGWMSIGISWSLSLNVMRAYFQGSQTGADQTGLDTWVGSLSNIATLIGDQYTTPTTPWSGSLARCALWSKALTVAQIRPASVV